LRRLLVVVDGERRRHARTTEQASERASTATALPPLLSKRACLFPHRSPLYHPIVPASLPCPHLPVPSSTLPVYPSNPSSSGGAAEGGGRRRFCDLARDQHRTSTSVRSGVARFLWLRTRLSERGMRGSIGPAKRRRVVDLLSALKGLYNW
jgi:hypothetical protein